jgi:hypothetical protein
MKKQLQTLMLVLSALGLSALPRTAEACDCSQPGDLPPLQFTPSDVVFLGRVVQVQLVEYVDLEVLETFHGRLARPVRVPIGRSDCDYFPTVPAILTVPTRRGMQFLVYGNIRDGKLVVGQCSGSGPLNEKTRELEVLRQRAQPRVR